MALLSVKGEWTWLMGDRERNDMLGEGIPLLVVKGDGTLVETGADEGVKGGKFRLTVDGVGMCGMMIDDGAGDGPMLTLDGDDTFLMVLGVGVWAVDGGSNVVSDSSELLTQTGAVT